MIGPRFGTVKSYFKNKLIFREGQPGNVGYLVKTGEVTIYKIINGEKKILSKLGPGEVFGEMGIVTESPRTAFAEASEYSDLVIIDRDTLLGMLKKTPKLIQSITLLLMKRLASTLPPAQGNCFPFAACWISWPRQTRISITILSAKGPWTLSI